MICAKKIPTKTPTIGVVGVTIPGAIDCINKINQHSRQHFEHHEHPNIILHQLNFAPTHQAQQENRWDIVEERLVESLKFLSDAKADFAIIPANTVHRLIDSVQSRSSIPVLNMLDIVATACAEQNLKKVVVMGTRWTMKDHLYKNALESRGILEVVPTEEDQLLIHNAIFNELIPSGSANSKTQSDLIHLVDKFKVEGCDGVVLACTELPLVLNATNCSIKVLDTTSLLAEAAVKQIFNNCEELTPINALGCK